MTLINKFLKWLLNHINPDHEKKFARQDKEVADFDDKLTAAVLLANYLDREINFIVYKLGKALPDIYYEDPKEEDTLTDEEIKSFLDKLHTYVICRDVANEKNQYWVKRYWARKRNYRETWYLDVNPSEPIWFYLTKVILKVIFYISVFAAACLYLYSNYI